METATITYPTPTEESIATRVLLAEDEPALRRANSRILRAAGCDVIEAVDGREALEAVRKQSFDVILTDITMPGIDGIQLLRHVREIDKDVPVVLITADPAVDSAVKAVEYGALKYLIKPVTRKQLIETVAGAANLGRVARLKREATLSLGSTGKLFADRATLEASLNRGIAGLWMAFQPIVNWKTRQVVAYEALMRTLEPSLPNPGVFLSVAERLDRVHEVSRAIRASIADTMARNAPNVDVFVNLHPSDLLDESLYSPDAPLAAFADRIVLEVTERQALDMDGDIRARIGRLRALGYRIAVDDLGAGYAGLNYFAHLTPDVVKLDMSLIRGIHEEGVKQKLVRSLVALCADLGVAIVAEGVETGDERSAIDQLGCDMQQGYLFARPGKPYPGVTW